MLTIITQTYATPSLIFINDDPAGAACAMPLCVILHNDKIEKVFAQSKLTIPLNPQGSITLLRPLTNLMATDVYYKFTATLISTESDVHEKTFEAHSYNVFDFAKKQSGINKYSITLNEHTTLQVQAHSTMVRLVNQELVEIQ